MGREEEKPSQVKTRDNQAEGISFRSRIEFQADNAQLVRSTSANVLVMVLQDCKSSPQKSRSLESGIGDVVFG